MKFYIVKFLDPLYFIPLMH